jgi:hypothetical protein
MGKARKSHRRTRHRPIRKVTRSIQLHPDDVNYALSIARKKSKAGRRRAVNRAVNAAHKGYGRGLFGSMRKGINRGVKTATKVGKRAVNTGQKAAKKAGKFARSGTGKYLAGGANMLLPGQLGDVAGKAFSTASKF